MTNETFGKMDRCLHCAVWDIINEASPKTADGSPIYSAEEIIGGLTEVLAEIIASYADRNQRRQLLTHMDKDMRAYVSKKVATGDHPRTGRGRGVH